MGRKRATRKSPNQRMIAPNVRARKRGTAMCKVYLAGPMVFYPDATSVFKKMKKILSGYGLVGVAPLDNQVGLEKVPPGRGLAEAIYVADENLMESVDAAIFNLDSFRRGTEMDAGTAFEIGFCRARGLPMAGWTVDGRMYPEKVRDFMQNIFSEPLRTGSRNGHGATSGELRDADGVLVHSEDMYQNLMVQMAIELSGGVISVDPEWFVAFEKAARHLSKSLVRRSGEGLRVAKFA